jgi:nucleoid-associated protein YgaU
MTVPIVLIACELLMSLCVASAVPAVADAGVVSPSEAVECIAKERAEGQSRGGGGAETSEADLRAAQAQDADAASVEARKRKQAEDLARRKAESDKIIAEELENLKKAREEADRAKAAKSTPAQATMAPVKARAATDQSSRYEASSRAGGRHRGCAKGRVFHRKGQRWYLTGAHDTLWSIAERFYGSGSAYRRIYRGNRKRLANPDVVRPCLALRLPGRG